MKKVLITALVVLSLVLAVSCTTNYTVKFEANEGTPAPAAQTIAAGGVVVEPVSPAKTGYTFTGWYKDSTCATKYDFATKVNSSFTLYAGFNKDATKSFTVTFNSNGGSTVDSQTVKAGECATRPYPNPTKIGYEFVDWYTVLGLQAGVAYSFTEKVESDLTLIAKWVDEAGAIIVTFDTNGGTPVPGKQGDDKAFYVAEPDYPQILGYDFVGWYTDKSLATPFYERVWDATNSKWVEVVNCFRGGSSAAKVGESMTLYAAYVDSGEFTVIDGVLTAVNYDDKSSVTSIVIPEGITAIADGVSGAGVFAGYRALNTVVIPSSLKYVGAYAFQGCKLERVLKYDDVMKGIDYSDFSVPYVKSVGTGSFSGLQTTGNYTVDSVTFEALEVIDCDPFYGMTATTLEEVYAPSVIGIGKAGLNKVLWGGDGYDGHLGGLKACYFPLISDDTQFLSKFEVWDGKAVVFVADGVAPITQVVSDPVLKVNSDGQIVVRTQAELRNAVTVSDAEIILGDNIIASDEAIHDWQGTEIGRTGTITVSGNNVKLDFNGKKISYAKEYLTVEVTGKNFTVYVYDLEDLWYFTCSGKVSGTINVVLAETSTEFTKEKMSIPCSFATDVVLDLNGFTLTFATGLDALMVVGSGKSVAIGNGTIKQEKSNQFTSITNIVENRGNLLLNKLSLNISNIDYANGCTDETPVFGVYNLGNLVIDESYLTFSAKADLTDKNNVKLCGIYNDNDGALAISGSTVTVDSGDCTASSYGVYNYVNAGKGPGVTNIENSTVNMKSATESNISAVFSESYDTTNASEIYMRGSNMVNITRNVASPSSSTSKKSYGLRAKRAASYIYWASNVEVTITDNSKCAQLKVEKEEGGHIVD